MEVLLHRDVGVLLVEVLVGFVGLGRFWFGPFGAVVVGFGRLTSVLFTLVGFGRFWIGCGRPW